MGEGKSAGRKKERKKSWGTTEVGEKKNKEGSGTKGT